MSELSSLGKLRQEKLFKFGANQDYTEKPCLRGKKDGGGGLEQ